MMDSRKPRRIVTTKMYLSRLGVKTTMASIGMGIFLFGVVCALLALLFTVIGLLNFTLAGMPVLLFMVALFGGGSAVLLYYGGRTVKEAKEINVGVPLMRANIGDLPVGESLVRASREPVQEQQAVLLRAATNTDTTPADQLVRAYQEPVQEEQTAFLSTAPAALTAISTAETELVQQRAG